MNSVERILTTLNFQEADRVPVLPILLLQGAKELKIDLPNYLQNSEHIANGQKALVEKYGHDGVYGFPHVVEDIEPFGGELNYVENGAPTVAKMAWRAWTDIDYIRTPNPKSHPSLVRTLKTIEILAKNFKGEKLIVGAAIAPFSLPSMLIGTEKWFHLLFWEDELIREPVLKKVLQITKDFCVEWSNAQLEAGADVVVLADGMASSTCITREHFEQFALSIIQETIEDIEGTVVYGPIGAIEPFIDLLPQVGASLVILESTDNIQQCKKIVDGKMGVMGNLNNIQLIRWNRETTLKKCMEIMDQVAKGGGFILGAQGPEIPWDVPEEAIQAIVDAARLWRP